MNIMYEGRLLFVTQNALCLGSYWQRNTSESYSLCQGTELVFFCYLDTPNFSSPVPWCFPVVKPAKPSGFCTPTFMRPTASCKCSWMTSYFIFAHCKKQTWGWFAVAYLIQGSDHLRAILSSFNHGSLFAAHSWLLVSRHATMALCFMS